MTDTPTRKRRWLYPVLFLSLALNLLIVGIVVGWLVSPGGPKRADFGTARGLVGEPFLRALPDEHRRELMREALQEAKSIRESRQALRARFEAFLEALRADPYDPARVESLMKEQRNVALRRQDIGETMLLNRLEEMSPEQRLEYADALEHSLRRLKRRPD